jgi:hypothetical protein
MRVRLLVVERSLHLQTLSDRLVAAWSLNHLETREVPVVGSTWRVGDRRLPEASLVLENDEDYTALRHVSAGLCSTRARLWRQLGFAALHSGNRSSSPGFVWTGLVLLIILAAASWRFLVG